MYTTPKTTIAMFNTVFVGMGCRCRLWGLMDSRHCDSPKPPRENVHSGVDSPNVSTALGSRPLPYSRIDHRCPTYQLHHPAKQDSGALSESCSYIPSPLKRPCRTPSRTPLHCVAGSLDLRNLSRSRGCSCYPLTPSFSTRGPLRDPRAPKPAFCSEAI